MKTEELLFGGVAALLVWAVLKKPITPPAPRGGSAGDGSYNPPPPPPPGGGGNDNPPPPPPGGGGDGGGGGTGIYKTLTEVDNDIVALLSKMPLAIPIPGDGYRAVPPAIYVVSDPSDPLIAPLGVRQATQAQADELHRLLDLQSPFER